MGNFPEPDSDLQGRKPFGTGRLADKLQAHFCWDAAALFPVALNAACHNVGPFGLATTGLGNDMIVGELF